MINPQTKKSCWQTGLYLSFVLATAGYLVAVLAWLLVYLMTGDGYGYFGLFNLIAVYLFAPLPLALIIGLFFRHRWLIAGALAGLIGFMYLWGPYFVPKQKTPPEQGPALRVMTYNLLAYHNQVDAITEAIRQADPDLILLQELRPDMASGLQQELGDRFPHHVFEPANSAAGIGTMSKFPLEPVDEALLEAAGVRKVRWIGGPQALRMDWQGQTVTVINFHLLSTPQLSSPDVVSRQFRMREAGAAALATLAQRTRPSILGGDANSVPISDAHQIFIQNLGDAWLQAGFGFGHTFPSLSTIPGSDRPQIGGWYVPPWLARIDYIYYSEDWVATEAQLGAIDGYSDHRGLVAVLQMR